MNTTHRFYNLWISTIQGLGIFALSISLYAPIHAAEPAQPSAKCLWVEWREYQSAKIPSDLGGYLEIKVDNFPVKHGPLTLTFSTSLWERLYMRESGRMIKARTVDNNSVLDRSKWGIYTEYGDRIHNVALHTQPYPFYMPGEQATVELFNDSRSWVETVKIAPHPLIKTLDGRSVEAELFSLQPLKYELKLLGFKDHETIQIATLPLNHSLRPRKLKSDPTRQHCTLQLNENEQKGREFIDLSVKTENSPTLQLQLPTISRLLHLHRESKEIANEMLGR